MRIYTDEQLEGLTPSELEEKLEQVKLSDELDDEEKFANIKKLETKLTGSIDMRDELILRDIKAGAADIDDMN